MGSSRALRIVQRGALHDLTFHWFLPTTATPQPDRRGPRHVHGRGRGRPTLRYLNQVAVAAEQAGSSRC